MHSRASRRSAKHGKRGHSQKGRSSRREARCGWKEESRGKVVSISTAQVGGPWSQIPWLQSLVGFRLPGLFVCLSVSYVRSYISYKSAASERQHPQWALCCSLRHSHCFLLSLSLSLSLSVRVCLFTHPIHSHIYVHRTVGMFDRPYCSFRPASRSTMRLRQCDSANATPPMRLRQCLICMHRHSLAAPRGHRAAQCTPHLAHRWRDRVSSRFSSRW